MIGIAAQVSLYPLHQVSLAPAIDEALQIFREHDLEVVPGPMSTLITGDDAALFAALREAFCRTAEQGHVVMVMTVSNACPVPSEQEDAISYRAIGHVENEFDAPVAPDKIRATESRVVLDPGQVEGLQGLEPGQQLMVIFHFHRSRDYGLRQHPRGDESLPPRGVFALRSPRRPNPIGVTVVDLLAVEGNVLRVRGLDAIDGTPVLDLKPV